MSRARKQDVLFIGVGCHVVAIHTNSGEELWRTRLKTATFVTVQVDGDRVYGGAGGELFCLEAASGQLLWQNKLKGLGLGLVAFPGTSPAVMESSSAQSTSTATM